MTLSSATRLPSSDHESYYRSIASESYIAVSLSGGTIYVLCSRTGSLLQKKPYVEENTQLIGGLVLDGDNLILSTSQSPIIRVYNMPTETIFSTLTCPDNQGVPILERLKSSKDECIVAAVHFNGEISILNISTQSCLRTIKVHDELAHFFTQLNDSKFATSSPDGTFVVSDWQTGEVRWKEKIGEAERRVDGKWVATGGFAQTFLEEWRIWEDLGFGC